MEIDQDLSALTPNELAAWLECFAAEFNRRGNGAGCALTYDLWASAWSRLQAAIRAVKCVPNG